MKIFAVSDIHGFYDEFYKALKEKGFEENNPEHLLVCCGDYFDRGRQPREVFNYLMSIDNVVLVKGNHEDLLQEMCNRGFAMGHDKGNGTVQTVKDLFPELYYNKFDVALTLTNELLQPLYDKQVNYFETKNYIFVHGWIPCEKYDPDTKSYWQYGKTFEYNPDWRNCNDVEWESARWINGIRRALEEKVLEPNKTIVCGHWHCSTGWAITENIVDFGEDAKWEPFVAEGIIAIDRCTAHTGKVNVIVLEDELLV